MATSKIKSCVFKSEWTNPNTNKIIYYHDIEFENGDKGQIGTMTANPDKLKVGTEHTYRVEDKNGNKKIVIEQQQQGFNRGSKLSPEQEERKQKMIVAQSSIASACNLFQGRASVDRTEILVVAEEFYNFVMKISEK